MLKYLCGRLLAAVPVVLCVSILVFSMLHLVPGDPVRAMFVESGGASQEQIDQIRHLLGLDKPLHIQYLDYVTRALGGDLGRSIVTKQSVSELILQMFPSTLQLTLAGMTLAVVLGLVFGIFAAVRHNSWFDNGIMLTATLGVSMPSFWLGLLLIYVFGIRLRWVPITAGSDLKRLALPALALGFQASAIIARLTRSSLLEVLKEDYIRTARAKGLRSQTVIIRHALRNALIPVVTMVGLQFGGLLGGAVIIEAVFARRGIGQLMVGALQARDFPLAQGCVLFIAVVYVLVNLGVDLLYAVIDPRINFQGTATAP
ncbi:MAG: ABC transporter permease [Chloroflexi bacterium]|nr:ABC transporter permease [Chloroflexota bacterium]